MLPLCFRFYIRRIPECPDTADDPPDVVASALMDNSRSAMLEGSSN